MGCVFHFVATKGAHPFDPELHREFKITQGEAPALKDVEADPLLAALLEAMLAMQPAARPTMSDVVVHPFFWPDERRLSFLTTVSDRMEKLKAEDALVGVLEEKAVAVFDGDWMQRLDSGFIGDIKKYRGYKGSSLRDLLRVMRNKHNHFDELPSPLQVLLVDRYEGFFRYFDSKFPRLLLEVFRFASETAILQENAFKKFLKH
jgi:serine/threonine-protein kinase/endoribonuclease IRE1